VRAFTDWIPVFFGSSTRSKPRRAIRSATFLLGGCLSLALTAACGSSSSGTSPGGNSTPSSAVSASPATLSAAIPAGTTLRVGDQLDALKNLLHEGGQDKNFPYKIQYSAFIGGPPMLQAFQAGALDTGFIGSTPLIFAQAAKQSLVAVAAWANPGSAYQLVVPGKSSVTGWASLKGKKVAFQQGTALEAALLTALNGVGLKLSDVQTVNVPTTQVSSALQSGSADAGILIEPLTSVFLAANPSAKVVATTSALTDRSNFIIAATKALNDPGKSAALADYIDRLAKSYAYLQKHPDLIVQTTYIGQYHLSPARAAIVAKQVGVPSFIQLPGDVAAAQQKLADLFQENGEIPSKVDAAQEFDSRFNAIVQKAQGQ
jgi:sulfonate transport system substrate-binding protein